MLKKAGIRITEWLHPIMMKVLPAKTTGKLKVTGALPKGGTYLIVANHLCIEDIPTLAEAVKEHFYLLVSDEDRNTLDGLTFLARSDRSFTRFDGYKVKPYEVENVIKDYPDVEYCVVLPFYDEKKYGNVIDATLVLASSRVLSRKEQVDFVRNLVQKCFISNANVSSRQIPARFHFRKDLPITKNGKVDYHKLENAYSPEETVCVDFEETNVSIGKITVH